MSGQAFSFQHGLFSAIGAVLLFIVLPDLLFTALEGSVSGLSLGGRALGVTATGVFIVAMAFCRGAFPRHSVAWALAGIGTSLFGAVFTYILLGTSVEYTTSGVQPLTFNMDLARLGLVIAAVMALNSLNNVIELSDARRRKRETDRVGKTKIAA
jgi:uncharacterized membrane protein